MLQTIISVESQWSSDQGFCYFAKRVFGFKASTLWSPMCLPRNLLDDLVDEFIDKNKKRLTRHIYFYTALKELK